MCGICKSLGETQEGHSEAAACFTKFREGTLRALRSPQFGRSEQCIDRGLGQSNLRLACGVQPWGQGNVAGDRGIAAEAGANDSQRRFDKLID